MISGLVNDRYEAILRLQVRGTNQVEIDWDATVDSGFTASLTLPTSIISSLGLVRLSRGETVMADGSIRHFDHDSAEVAWDGEWRKILVSAVGADCLIGMKLLAGYELRIEVVPEGVVEISSLL
jgi:clan AA aspartic protease